MPRGPARSHGGPPSIEQQAAKVKASEGYSIMADFGDQYSDLLGGNAGHQVKIPNPMYYLP